MLGGSLLGGSLLGGSVLGGSLLAGADISLPEAARRSLTGEFLPPRSSSSTALAAVQRSGELEDSDSEEEIISGMLGSRILGSRRMKEEGGNVAFLLS